MCKKQKQNMLDYMCVFKHELAMLAVITADVGADLSQNQETVDLNDLLCNSIYPCLSK